MKKEIERAMREVLEAWETPDSPEAFAGAIYQMKRVYMAQVIENLNNPKMGRPRKLPTSKKTSSLQVLQNQSLTLVKISQ